MWKWLFGTSAKQRHFPRHQPHPIFDQSVSVRPSNVIGTFNLPLSTTPIAAAHVTEDGIGAILYLILLFANMYKLCCAAELVIMRLLQCHKSKHGNWTRR